MKEKTNHSVKMSIGALSSATGIPVETLRTWERRYGFPEAHRLPSGHRRYSEDTLGHLNLVKKALDLGHKPSDIAGLELNDLKRLAKVVSSPPVLKEDSELVAQVDLWMSYVHALDGYGLERCFRLNWQKQGAMHFLGGIAGLFLNELGEAWARGEIGIVQEHYASERFRDFLVEKWRTLLAVTDGPQVICSTLPGEHHVLGLHMAAVVLAQCNVNPIFLGTDTPVKDIVHGSEVSGAPGIVLSISQAADPYRVYDHLSELRAAVTPAIEIVVGGRGAVNVPDGITSFSSIGALTGWATALYARNSVRS